MQVIANRHALLEVLKVAAGIAASRTPKEILRCVRLTTVDGTLLVSATDLEVALRGEVRQVEVKEPGELLVPADKLAQIVQESTDETLVVEGGDEACHVRGQDSHFEVYGQDPREFPPVPELEGTPDLVVEADTLHGLIEKTIFAVAKESTRYAIKGVLWQKEGKKLSLIATDGRRLARAVGLAKSSVGGKGQVIVPAKTVQILQRILGGEELTAAARFSANQVVLSCGCYVLSSAVVEGHFPQYEEIIPKDCDKIVELRTDEFLSAVRRAALLASEQSKGIRLAFASGGLTLSSRAPEQGEATISMEVGYAGEPLEIGFNPQFLADALRVAGAPVVRLELKARDRPGVLRVGDEFLYVVMPVNLA